MSVLIEPVHRTPQQSQDMFDEEDPFAIPTEADPQAAGVPDMDVEGPAALDNDHDNTDPLASFGESTLDNDFDDDPLASAIDDDDTAGPSTHQPFGESLLDTMDADDGFGVNMLDADASPFGDEDPFQASPLETLAQQIGTPPEEDSLPSFSQLFPPASCGPSTARILSNPLSSISARSFSGKLVLFPRRAQKNSPTTKSCPSATEISKLLAVPMHRMMENLSTVTAASITAAGASSNVATSSTASSSHTPPKDMWVDKYRPKRFTDLVGDESVNRSTLAWLKEWDPCVFKKKPTKRKRDADAAAAAAAAKDDNGMVRAPDEWGRPYEKILLIAGPPGLGKTTLAHVVATQAGYSVLEINASDARTGNIIDERIKPALETGQGLGRSKPVLVVVDEVDGATGENSGSFVAKLVQLTIDGKRKRLKSGEQRNPKEKRPLLRPIICICNDLWAPSIAKLRAVARIVKFQPAAPAQLVKRLRAICETESLHADARALTLLAGVAKSDFRGCLNTLQMIHTRKQEVTEAVVRQATVGMKENETTTQAVWNDIFLPLSKKRVKDAGMSEEEKRKYVPRLARLVEASGTLDKIMLGCFAHYATLHHQDPSWKRFTDAHTWFGAFDRFSSTMRSEQEYAVLAYLPYFVVPIHPLFVDGENSKVGNPREDWECFTKTKASEEIYKSLSASVIADHGRHSASFRHLLNKEVLITEFAPLLNRIISPPLRPVGSQIIRPAERATLKKLVDVMVSLELRFVQEKGEDGQQMYRLDPPIDIFVTYEGKRAADIAPSKYAVRHMVAAELEAEYVARHAEAVDKNQGQGRKVASFFGRKKAPIAEDEEAEDVSTLRPDGDDGETLTKVAAERPDAKKKEKKVDWADRPPVDFFGRPIKRKEPEPEPAKGNATTTTASGPPVKKFKVIYRFNEGASAAVRKPVKMSALL